MFRFFVPPVQLDTDRPVITGDDVKHIVKVLRLRPGDEIVLLDGAGRAARAVVRSFSRDHVECAKTEDFIPGGEPPIRVTLAQGLAKGDKMDLIIQKATELGVAEIIPMACSRSVVRLDKEKTAGRQSRWQRVAMEAAKQCRRAKIPAVCAPMEFEQVLKDMPVGIAAFLPWEEEGDSSLRQVLHGAAPAHVYIFIGPEGGFERQEVEAARRCGVTPVTLGPRILRTETAGLACLAIIMHHWGDVG